MSFLRTEEGEEMEATEALVEELSAHWRTGEQIPVLIHKGGYMGSRGSRRICPRVIYSFQHIGICISRYGLRFET